MPLTDFLCRLQVARAFVRMEAVRRQEAVDERAAEAYSCLVLLAEEQLTDELGVDWGGRPQPRPRFCAGWVQWNRERQALLARRVRLLQRQRAQKAAAVVVAGALKAAVRKRLWAVAESRAEAELRRRCEHTVVSDAVWAAVQTGFAGRKGAVVLRREARNQLQELMAGGAAQGGAAVGGEEGGASEAPVGPRGPPTDSNEGNLVPLAGGPARAVSSKEGTGAGSPARQPQPASTEQHASDLCSSLPAGGSAAGRQETDAPSTPSSNPTPGGSKRTRRRRRGRAVAKGKGKGKGKGKAEAVVAVATVDQFIRHAESGFFGDDEEADCPFVWDGDC